MIDRYIDPSMDAPLPFTKDEQLQNRLAAMMTPMSVPMMPSTALSMAENVPLTQSHQVVTQDMNREVSSLDSNDSLGLKI
ncbi:MAG: hypothetical protein WAZ18_02615 [Alphaproteobacteria bacterium]